MRGAVLWSFASVAWSVFATSVVPAQDYTITVDGKPPTRGNSLLMAPTFVSLVGNPEGTASGDLVWIGRALVRLDEPGTYEFADRMKRDGRVLLRRGDAERIAAVTSDRLLECDLATRRQLLGVVVQHWNDEVGKALADLDPTAPIVVSSEAAVGDHHALPPLPAATRHLVLLHDTQHGFGDCSAALSLTELRSLELDGTFMGFSSVDLESFSRAEHLRWLRSGGPKLVNADAVRHFRALRWCDAHYADLTSFEPFAHTTELRWFRMWGPDDGAPLSLAPLAKLSRLEFIELRGTPIGDLPAQGFPRARSFIAWGCGLRVSQQRAFLLAHPECVFRGEVDDRQLQDALRVADRLELRTAGGVAFRTEIRRDERPRVLFETADAPEIAKVAAMLRVIDGAEATHCHCHGSSRLVFFERGIELASVGMHHGTSIRWDRGSHGSWNFDGRLQDAAADALVEWLAAHGDGAARRERKEKTRSTAAATERARHRGALLGATIDAGADANDLQRQWAARLPESQGDEATLLRLLGCHEGAWNQVDEFDADLLKLLVGRRFEATEWGPMVATARTDERAAIGLAAVFVDTRGRLTLEQRAEVLAIVAHAALCHPRSWNRARMLQCLRDEPAPGAIEALNDAFAGEFVPRKVSADALVAPPGSAPVQLSDPVLDAEHASLRALAAVCLVARGFPQPARELVAKLPADSLSARVLRKALERMEKPR